MRIQLNSLLDESFIVFLSHRFLFLDESEFTWTSYDDFIKTLTLVSVCHLY